MIIIIIIITEKESKSRLCKQFNETVEHIISTCPMLAKKKQYKKRHDAVWAQLHFNICKEIGVKIRG
jgi:hypothetical protein